MVSHFSPHPPPLSSYTLQFEFISDWVRYGDSVSMAPLVPARDGWLGWGQFIVTAMLKPRVALRLLIPPDSESYARPAPSDFLSSLVATVRAMGGIWSSLDSAIVPGTKGLPAGVSVNMTATSPLRGGINHLGSSAALTNTGGGGGDGDTGGMGRNASKASMRGGGASTSTLNTHGSPSKRGGRGLSTTINHVHNHHFSTLGPLLVNRFLWLTALTHTALSSHFATVREHGHHALTTIAIHFNSMLDSVRRRALDLTAQYVDRFMAQPLKDALISIYAQHIDSTPAATKMGAVVNAFFCPGWHDLNEAYFLQEAAQLPDDFEECACSALQHALTDCTLYGAQTDLLLEGDQEEWDENGADDGPTWVTDVTLSGCAVGEANERARAELAAMFDTLQVTKAWEEGVSDRVFPALATLGATDFILIDEVIRAQAEAVLASLPEEIHMGSSNFAEIVAHKNTSTSLGAAGGGKKAPLQQSLRQRLRKVSIVALKEPHASAVPPPKTFVDPVKFYKESGLVLSDTRHVEPLWAAAVLEVHAYNQAVRTWRHGINTHASAAAAIGDERAAQLLLEGRVPAAWLRLGANHADTGPTVVWADALSVLAQRRAQTAAWLQRGTPGALRMSLLSDPAGLVHACKERFAAIVGTKSSNVDTVVSVVEVEELTPELCQGITNDAYGSAIIVRAAGVHNGILSRSVRPQPATNKEDVYDINAAPASALTRVEQMVHLKIKFRERRAIEGTDSNGRAVVYLPVAPLPEGVHAVTLPVYSTSWEGTVDALVTNEGKAHSSNKYESEREEALHKELLGKSSPLMHIALETETEPSQLEMNGTCLHAL